MHNPTTKRFRLYLDESGDHTNRDLSGPDKRYLGLTGVVIETEAYRTRFHPALEELKQRHFPHDPDDPVVLHRKELVNGNGSFWRLRDATRRSAFDADLLRFLAEQDYVVITVVIDKLNHLGRYGDRAIHPYHYCLIVMLERYCGLLAHIGACGDVMAEKRGGEEDSLLKAAYQRVYDQGTPYRGAGFFQQTLTSKELKLKPKTANIAGLQVADLLAYPCKQILLSRKGRVPYGAAGYGADIYRCIMPKINRRLGEDRSEGYGEVFLG